jgi:hypothetical protein
MKITCYKDGKILGKENLPNILRMDSMEKLVYASVTSYQRLPETSRAELHIMLNDFSFSHKNLPRTVLEELRKHPVLREKNNSGTNRLK